MAPSAPFPDINKRPFSTMGADYYSSGASILTSGSRFTYHLSASFSAKQKKFSPTTNIFNFNPYNRVQDTASKKSRPDAGQDAFFISRINESGAVALGVTDGVGGYADAGIDSAEFSHTFCERMATAAHQASPDAVSAKSLISAGYQRILDEDVIQGGAATACIGVGTPDGQLNVANLGDSGFLIIRQGKVHYASEPQTHAFNTPFQLAMIPKRIMHQARIFGGEPLSDKPSDAFVSSHVLRNGDVIIFATDGVWDNLSSQEVLRIVSDEMVTGNGWSVNEGGISPSSRLAAIASFAEGPGIQSAVAKAIVAKAKSASINTKVDGPFAREVQKLYPGESFHGGKKDDICVICMVVVEESEEKISKAPKL